MIRPVQNIHGPEFIWRRNLQGAASVFRLDDHTNYFNVYIDGSLFGVFHGTQSGKADYVLAKNLPEGNHTLLLSRRNITFEEPYSFYGLLLDSAAWNPPPFPEA